MIKKDESRINFLVALHLVAIIGLIFPYGFPLFPVVTLLFLIYTFLKKNISLRMNYYTIILYLVILLYIVGVSNSEGIIYIHVMSDLINISLLTMILLSVGNYSLDEYKKVIHKTLIISSYIIPVLAIISLYKYYMLLNGVYFPYLEVQGRPYPRGTSLMPDYNMFSLGMLIGIISISYLIKKSEKSYIQLYGMLSSILLIVNSLLSGSRRGFVVLPLVTCFLIYIVILRLAKNTARTNFILLSLVAIFSITLYIGNKEEIDLTITNQYEIERVEGRYLTLKDGSSSFDSRSKRWKYGIDIIKDFKAHNLVIGDGFNYLILFGDKYGFTRGQEGYPHNPLISAFLYSGIVGFTVATFLILVPIIRVLLNNKLFIFEYFIIYLITVVFILQSGNSIFSHHILWLILAHFCFLPMNNPENHKESLYNNLRIQS